ncbi:hypothetical protein [Bacillus sp. FJAT-45350]|uniref:hypothetical protein n=1 Tax=Bacillus sp. FJAT-45350 TaxID=2011014 RepID=UPI000BB6E07B|nr:hypothetical protein [Bacillus sp. FJAT-45350]
MLLKKRLLISLFTCTLILSFFIVDLAHAHRMLVEVKEDSIHVRYDDGTNAELAVVSGYDEEHNLLFEGTVNEDGYYELEPRLDIARITADDGIGHRASWSNEQEQNTESNLDQIPLLIRALLGISILVFIASFFFYRRK